MNNKNLDLTVYFIAGPQDFPKLSIAEATEKISSIIKSGVSLYQFRDKGTVYEWENQRFEVAKKLQEVAKKAEVTFIVNDDVQLASDLKADGVHLGQSDGSVSKVRELLGQKVWLGLSVSTEQELKKAQTSGADYLGIGPIYPTSSKADAAKPLGFATLEKILPSNHLPIVGIGGISQDSLTELSALDLDGLAVISLLIEAQNPEEMSFLIKQKMSKNQR